MKNTEHRRGIGVALLARLLAISEADGYWTLQGQVMDGNAASRALLLGAGFREIGRRERYGHIDGDWRDVILLERRSAIAGGPGLPTHSCEAG